MGTGSLLGLSLGICVTFFYTWLGRKILWERHLDRGEGDVTSPPYGHFDPQTTIEKTWIINGKKMELVKRIGEQLNMRAAGITFRLRNFSSEEISFIDNGFIFPGLHLCEGHFHLEEVADGQTKVTYELSLTPLRRFVHIIYYLLILTITLPIAVGIPWLVYYIVTRYHNQKIQLVQLVHLIHLLWPVVPLLIYARLVSHLDNIFESLLVNLKLEKAIDD